MKEKIHLEIEAIHNKIVDISLLAFTVTYLPILVMSVMRSMVTGWTLFSKVFPLLMSYFIVVYIARKRVPYLIRKYSLIIGVILIAILSYYSNGMLGLGAAILIMAVVLTALTSTIKVTGILMVITTTVIVIFRVLVSQRMIQYPYDIEVFFYSPTAWNGQLIGFLTLTIVSLTAVLTMLNNYNRIFEEMRGNERVNNTILESLEDPYFCIDRNKNLLLVSDSFREVYEFGEENVLGKPMSYLFNLKVYEEVSKQVELRKNVDRAIDSQKSLSFQTYCMIGEEHRVNKCKMIPVWSESEQIDMVIIQYTDVTEIVSDYISTHERLVAENKKMKQLITENRRELGDSEHN